MNNPDRQCNTIVAAINVDRSLWLAQAFAAAAQTGGFFGFAHGCRHRRHDMGGDYPRLSVLCCEELFPDAAGGTQGALLREASRMQACAGMASVPGGLTLDRIEQGGNDNGKAD